MKIKIKRIDKSLPLPEYKTKGAVAFDIYSRIAAKIKPQEVKLLPTNLIIKVPKGYFLLVASRSGTFKKGLMMANNVGILDQDYNGPEDELNFAAYNFSAKPVKIEVGERIAQGLMIPVKKVCWQEAEKISKKSRGGFGSTGKR